MKKSLKPNNPKPLKVKQKNATSMMLKKGGKMKGKSC
jgi:hypothetical protein